MTASTKEHTPSTTQNQGTPSTMQNQGLKFSIRFLDSLPPAYATRDLKLYATEEPNPRAFSSTQINL